MLPIARASNLAKGDKEPASKVTFDSPICGMDEPCFPSSDLTGVMRQVALVPAPLYQHTIHFRLLGDEGGSVAANCGKLKKPRGGIKGRNGDDLFQSLKIEHDPRGRHCRARTATKFPEYPYTLYTVSPSLPFPLSLCCFLLLYKHLN